MQYDFLREIKEEQIDKWDFELWFLGLRYCTPGISNSVSA
jgi:hypothetical protein